jgi:hypothetical protein
VVEASAEDLLMIWESYYWKTDLLKYAASLKKRSNQKRWVDASSARCEQTIMLGFYAIRKLAESKKLTDKAAKGSIKIIKRKSKGKVVHYTNYHRAEELYEFDGSGTPSTISIIDLCNQVIHSYAFFLVMNSKHQLDGFLVTSDRDRKAGILQVKAVDAIALFEKVGRDDIRDARLTFNEKKQDYDVDLR